MPNLNPIPSSPRHVPAGAVASGSGQPQAGTAAPATAPLAGQTGGLGYARSPSASVHPSIRQARKQVSILPVPIRVSGEPDDECALNLVFSEQVPDALSQRIVAMLGTVELAGSSGDKLVFIEGEVCCHEGFEITKSMQEGASTYTLSMQVDPNDNVTRCKLTEATPAGRRTLLAYGCADADHEDSPEASGDGESSAAAGPSAKHGRAAADSSEDEGRALPKRPRLAQAAVQSTARRQEAGAEASRPTGTASTSRVLRSLTHATPLSQTTAYIRANFSQRLQDMLTNYLFTVDPSEQQKQDNTYHATWVLPMEKRFLAAVLQTAYDACKNTQVEITPENADRILNHVVQTLGRLSTREKADINVAFTRAHDMTNDGNPALTLKDALKGLPSKFTKKSVIDTSLERVAAQISAANPACPVDTQQLARQCVPGCVVDYLQTTLMFDADNPFLPYLEDTAEKPALLNKVQAWDYITRNVDQELSPSLLTNIWAICSGEGAPAANRNHALPAENGNRTVLMEAGANAPQGTLTTDGRADLMARLDRVAEEHGITITVGHEDDDNDSREYGRTVVTLEREDVPVKALNRLLASIVSDCKQKMAEAAGDEDKMTAAQIRLAMDLTQCRLFPDENLTAGLMAINLLRLQNGQSVPLTLPNPDVLDGHSLPEIMAIVRAGET